MNNDARFTKRLRKARDKGGLTQREAASVLGVSETTYRNYEKGRSTPEKVDVDEAVKLLESGEAASDDSNVRVPLFSIEVNAGTGEPALKEEVREYVTYNRDHIHREIGINPDELAVLTVTGNSMEPTLRPGDRVLVVLHNGRTLRDGGIYVVRNPSGGIIVKRLYWEDETTARLQGDNDRVPDNEIQADENGSIGQWEVLGRVVRVEKHL